MSKKFSYTLFKILILFYICWGAYAWFTWGFEENNTMKYIIRFVGVIITIIYQNKYKIKLRFSLINVIAYIILYAAFFLNTKFYGTGILTSPIHFFLVFYPLMVLSADRINAEETLSFVSKCLAVLLIPSLILYVVLQFAPSIPGLLIDLSELSNTYYFYNYLFLLKPLVTEFRYCAFFLEPSYLAVTCVFLLYAQGYDFKKWENKVILIALLVSTSFAGYVIGFLGYIITKYLKGSSVLSYVILFVFIVVFYQVSNDYNGGNNLINNYIIKRIQSDTEQLGGSRMSKEAGYIYEQMVSDGSIWLGKGTEYLKNMEGAKAYQKINGDGYMMYFMKFGIVTTVLYFIFYWLIGVTGNKGYIKKRMIGFFLLLIVLFIPTAHIHDYNWLIPFILASRCAL